jgi:hypothetical protein
LAHPACVEACSQTDILWSSTNDLHLSIWCVSAVLEYVLSELRPRGSEVTMDRSIGTERTGNDASYMTGSETLEADEARRGEWHTNDTQPTGAHETMEE